jgi:hypothetical protein
MRNETWEQRSERLIAQAAAMRERQAQKRATQGYTRPKHVCPPNGVLDDQYEKLMAGLARVAPANIAPIPVAMMLEDGLWTVDVHVRIKGVTEYEVSGAGETLSDALTNAQRQLANRSTNERRAYRDTKVYSISF